MFLFIDNYDSFSYNLVQLFNELGRFPLVKKNDDPVILELAQSGQLSAVCISPGPGSPQNAGYCLEFLDRLPHHIPLIGVCLGHQLLACAAGALVAVNKRVMHGKHSHITHNGQGLFQGLPQNMQVGRYHSLVVRPHDEHLLETCARTEEGEIMALRYKDRPWAGVQFHPESILTPQGKRLLANFPQSLLTTKRQSAPVEKKCEAFQVAEVMESLAQGRDLSRRQADEAFARLMDGELTSGQAGALLLGLRGKGEKPLEVIAAAKAVLARAIKIPRTFSGPVIDIVGTGGDGKFSFNCSTATALMLAAMGHKVLKHGNRSVSSRSGSADVLEQLGMPLHVPPRQVAATLARDNFVFLFAPDYHPAFHNVMPIRRELGVRTLFNLLGPLVNPAEPTHHLLGVARPESLPLIAQTLAELNNRAIGAVVCGAGGYDELTPLGVTEMIMVERGTIREARLDPMEYGCSPCSEQDLAISDARQGAQVLKLLLKGSGPRPMRDMLALNLGMALYLLDSTVKNNDQGYDKVVMRAAMREARQAIDNGVGRRFACLN